MRILDIHNCPGEELAYILERSPAQDNPDVEQTVRQIITDVRKRGDEAVLEYTRKFDWPTADTLRLPDDKLKELASSVPDKLLAAIRLAKNNVEEFHRQQVRKSWSDSSKPGKLVGQIVRPVERTGVHVPAFAAPLPSSLLMSAIPAKVAGVKEVYVATPPGRDGLIHPAVAAAAVECDVDAVFRMGGAQAIAAFAYGTQSVPRVDVIVGPGNIYTTVAKRMVFGQVGIDMLAGPSEILVVADETANPRFIAADLLSQAEHQTDSRAILVTTSYELAREVHSEIERQLKALPRGGVAQKSLTDNGAILLVRDLNEAIEIANRVAPEHLQLMVRDPLSLLDLVTNAGAIFLGEWSPEPIGDYLAGPNHVLPTSGTARFSSPLTVDNFVKVSSVIMYTQKALEEEGPDAVVLAEAEGLDAHANSVRIRLRPQS